MSENNLTKNRYMGPRQIESFLLKKKKAFQGRQKFTRRYCKFCLNEKSFSYRDCPDNPEIKKIYIGKDLKGFDDILSEQDKALYDSPFGFYLLTTNQKYVLFAEKKEIYNKWLRILNFFFKKIDINNPHLGSLFDQDINQTINKIDNKYDFMNEDIDEISGDRSPHSNISNIFEDFSTNNKNSNITNTKNSFIKENNISQSINKINSSKYNFNEPKKNNRSNSISNNYSNNFLEKQIQEDNELNFKLADLNNINLNENVPENKQIKNTAFLSAIGKGLAGNLKKNNVVFVKPNQNLIFENQENKQNEKNHEENFKVKLNNTEYRSKTPNKDIEFKENMDIDDWINFGKQPTVFGIKKYNDKNPNKIPNYDNDFKNKENINNIDEKTTIKNNIPFPNGKHKQTNFNIKEQHNNFTIDYKFKNNLDNTKKNLINVDEENAEYDKKSNLLRVESSERNVYNFHNMVNNKVNNNIQMQTKYNKGLHITAIDKENLDNEKDINEKNKMISSKIMFEEVQKLAGITEIRINNSENPNNFIYKYTNNPNGKNTKESNVIKPIFQNSILNNSYLNYNAIKKYENKENYNKIGKNEKLLAELEEESSDNILSNKNYYNNKMKINYRSKSENKIIEFGENPDKIQENLNVSIMGNGTNMREIFQGDEGIIEEANLIVNEIKKKKNIFHNQQNFDSNWEYENESKIQIATTKTNKKKEYLPPRKPQNLFDDPNLHIRVSGNNKKLALENLHYGGHSKPVSSFNDLIPVVEKENVKTYQKFNVTKRNEESLVGKLDLTRDIKINANESVTFKKNISQNNENFTLNFVVPEQLSKNSQEADRIKVIKEKILQNSSENCVYLGKLKNINMNNTANKSTVNISELPEGEVEKTAINDENLDINPEKLLTGNFTKIADEKSLMENPKQKVDVTYLLKKVPDKLTVYKYNKSREGAVEGLDLRKHVIFDEHHAKITNAYKMEEFTHIGDDFHIPHTFIHHQQDGEFQVNLNLDNVNLLNHENNHVVDEKKENKGNQIDNSLIGNEISSITRQFSMINDDEPWDYSVIDNDFSLNEINNK